MDKISLIVPIYNVVPFLDECLSSIEQQEQENLEVILVNDGSTDKPFPICNEYCMKHLNWKYLEKENGGLSSARNYGMEHATGDWVFFLDSDDKLEPGALSTLLYFAAENNCEVVQGGFRYWFDNSLASDNLNELASNSCCLSREQAMMELIVGSTIKNFAWGKLYKKEIIDDIPFAEGKFFEDSFWQHLVFNRITKLGIVNQPCYYYRQRPSSISGQLKLNALDLIDGYEKRYEFVKKEWPLFKGKMALVLWQTSYNLYIASKKCPKETHLKFRAKYAQILEKYNTEFTTYLVENRGFKWAQKGDFAYLCYSKWRSLKYRIKIITK